MASIKSPIRIGIPKALYYYTFPYLWEAFFCLLGHIPVISHPTTRSTIGLASRISEAEHCLPMKIFDAHVSELKDKSDLIFIPRILSCLKGHISCPKLSVLADVAKLDKKAKILSLTIDERREPLKKSLKHLAKRLGASRKRANQAVHTSIEQMQKVQKKINENVKDREKYLILGHPYNIHDPFLSDMILKKLYSMDLNLELFTYESQKIPANFIKWDTCSKMYKKILELDAENYDGIIQISSFNCGCDSIMVEFFKKAIREKGIPYMVLLLDEHSASVGMDTRLEVFVDSIRGQK